MPASLRPPLLKFPRRFVWGVAAAAPQIEGAAFEDGKAASIWDTFARQPGAVHKGDTLDVACDHYHRFDRDFALMAKLGIRHYRLSLAWPRIFPHGDRTLNQPGLDFYHRIFDSLDRHGITPWVTMFHWDLPQALEDRGGWRSPEVVDAFAHYADTIVRAYGARVRHWITLNEIHCFTLFGYGGGGKAPGTSEPAAVVNQTYHHALLCHGHGVRAVREHGRRGARVGLTDVPFNAIPVTETEPDIAAARAVFIEDNIRVLDPIHRGRYATSYLRREGRDAPRHHARDFDLISLPTDFLGLNVYTGTFVRRGARGRPERISFPASYPAADCTWLKHVPQSIYWGPRFATELYAPASIYITENGAGYEDAPPVAGQVDDLHRRDLVRNYLRELHCAITDGVPVDGYFLWSFMDNFEWQDGYSKRFGIVYTDYATQRRIPKLSAHWYSQVIAHNALV